MEYKAKTKIHWIQNKAKFQQMLVGLDKPYKIAFFFVRNSARAFDYVNVAQLPLDLMQEYGWIENDNMLNVLPIFAGYNVDKTKPGVYISVVK